MKKLLTLALFLCSFALLAQPIQKNYYTTNAAPSQGSATNGIQISGGVGTNNILYGLTVVNPAAQWPANAATATTATNLALPSLWGGTNTVALQTNSYPVIVQNTNQIIASGYGEANVDGTYVFKEVSSGTLVWTNNAGTILATNAADAYWYISPTKDFELDAFYIASELDLPWSALSGNAPAGSARYALQTNANNIVEVGITNFNLLTSHFKIGSGGLLGRMFTVDAVNGDDARASAGVYPFKTLTAATLTATNNDTFLIYSGNYTGRWVMKDGQTMIGVGMPRLRSTRATSQLYAPVIVVTNNNSFSGIQFDSVVDLPKGNGSATNVLFQNCRLLGDIDYLFGRSNSPDTTTNNFQIKFVSSFLSCPWDGTTIDAGQFSTVKIEYYSCDIEQIYDARNTEGITHGLLLSGNEQIEMHGGSMTCLGAPHGNFLVHSLNSRTNGYVMLNGVSVRYGGGTSNGIVTSTTVMPVYYSVFSTNNLIVGGGGAFIGDGAGVTTLNASNLSSGVAFPARLATNAASAGQMLYATSAGTTKWDAAPSGTLPADASGILTNNGSGTLGWFPTASLPSGTGGGWWQTNAAAANFWTNYSGGSNVISGANLAFYPGPNEFFYFNTQSGQSSKIGSLYLDNAENHFIGDVIGRDPGDFDLNNGEVENLTVNGTLGAGTANMTTLNVATMNVTNMVSQSQSNGFLYALSNGAVVATNDAVGLTNLLHAPIVVAGDNVTVTATTNTTTGQRTYEIDATAGGIDASGVAASRQLISARSTTRWRNPLLHWAEITATGGTVPSYVGLPAQFTSGGVTLYAISPTVTSSQIIGYSTNAADVGHVAYIQGSYSPIVVSSNFYFGAVVRCTNITNVRFLAGATTATLPLTSQTAATRGVYFRISTNSANWFFVSGDNSTQTATDTGIAFDNGFHLLEIFPSDDTGLNFTGMIDGVQINATNAVPAPFATSHLVGLCSLEAAVKAFEFKKLRYEFQY